MTNLSGAIIRTVRLNRGLTLSNLAEHTRYSLTYLSFLERGVMPITEKARTRFRQAFNAIGVSEAEVHAAIVLLEVSRRAA